MNKNKNTIKLNGNNLISINNENKNIFYNKYQDFKYPLENEILQFHHIENALTVFWKIIENLNELNIIQIQFKIQSGKKVKKSISYVGGGS